MAASFAHRGNVERDCSTEGFTNGQGHKTERQLHAESGVSQRALRALPSLSRAGPMLARARRS
jgi:hypothetical protein